MKYSEIKAAGDTANTVAANSLLMVCQTPETDPQTKVISITNFANSFNRVAANAIPLMPNTTPANSSVTCTKGTMWYDSQYLYVATADNTVKRIALTSF